MIMELFSTKRNECTEAIGKTNVTENTTGHLEGISRQNLNEEFYRGLGFDETIWDFTKINSNNCPKLK